MLQNDDVLILSSLPPELSIRAVVSGSPASVVFGFDANPAYQTENAAPFALGGDSPLGDYLPITLAGGDHTLTATPYAASGGTGAAGGALVVKFSVLTTED